MKEKTQIKRKPALDPVTQLLAEAHLPIEDITDERLEHFFGAWAGSRFEGVVGLELYGVVALLRSLTVLAQRRGLGLGTELLSSAEHYGGENGVQSVFLLTTTAKPYFEKHGYVAISRDSAPAPIRATREFSSICPASAVLMMKCIGRCL